MKTKTDTLYHDINSSLVILKLTLESLKELPIEDIQNPSKYASLINLLEEGMGQIEGGFRNWNVIIGA